MVRNQRTDNEIPDALQGKPIWKTRMLWPLRQLAKLADGNLAVDENAVHTDQQGAYVWKVQNRTINQAGATQSNVLQVVKTPVKVLKQKIPFLGLYTMQVISLPEGADFDIGKNLVLGKLTGPTAGATYQGSPVVLDQSRWLIQPGDMIGVQLRRRGLKSGLYVPLDAIDERPGGYYVFLITSKGLVRPVQVETHESVDTLRRITPKQADALNPGDRLIASGVHFLVKDEQVEVTEELQVLP